jgi:hypothetical protein
MTAVDKTQLGRVDNVDPRTVWPHEARDLTPWVLDNIQLLGEELGIDIRPTQREVAVGNFSLDVLGEDSGGHAVIVENQLEATDHTHLGQLLVYASGLEAAVVVWLTPKFRDEHRRALDWLNERTDEQVNFFGVELQLIRIGDSPPAPLFRVIARPNDWQKAVKRGLTATAQTRHDFFEQAVDALVAKVPTVIRPKVGYKSWVSLARGPFGSYAIAFTAAGLRAEAYLDMTIPSDGAKRLFDRLVSSEKAVIEGAVPGDDVSWERLDGKRACRIAVYHDAPDFADDVDVAATADWAADRLAKLLTFETLLRETAQAVRAEAQFEG